MSRFLYYEFVSNNQCELSVGLSVLQLNFLLCFLMSLKTGIWIRVCSREMGGANKETEASRGAFKWVTRAYGDEPGGLGWWPVHLLSQSSFYNRGLVTCIRSDGVGVGRRQKPTRRYFKDLKEHP